MKKYLIALLLVTFTTPIAKAEKKCGELYHTTPGNYWLKVGNDILWIGMQGGHRAQGLDEIETLIDTESKDMWIKTQASHLNYGYGCACIEADISKNLVERIRNLDQRPSAVCENKPLM